MAQDFWRLPKGVDEVLPPLARHLELLRREVLDLFECWGYDYIEPPIIEYLDALLVGNDLKLQTLQVADQISGRTLGVRADMTSQAARIDANSLSRRAAADGVTDSLSDGADCGVRRLCYAGPTVRANPQGVLESRVPLKAGAEIYGCADVEADIEIMCLAIDALKAAGLAEVIIELGHVGFVSGLVGELKLTAVQQNRLLEAVRIKSEADVQALLNGLGTPVAAKVSQRLCRLVRMMGGADALKSARELFTEQGANLLELVDQLDYCAARLAVLRPDVEVRFDLSAPVGFGYHQALVFALFERGHGRAIARGGRYDDIGEQFGNARPATGFDVNLKTLLGLDSVARRLASESAGKERVWVAFFGGQSDGGLSAQQVAALSARIAALRTNDQQVIQGLTEDEAAPENCTHELILNNEDWRLAPIRNH